MVSYIYKFRHSIIYFLISIIAISCAPIRESSSNIQETTLATQTDVQLLPTHLPTRPVYSPGELVDYFSQTGDTLPAIAAHFNTTEKEIREANTILPERVTTLPPGLPLKIPIYYEPFWGSPFQIIPDWVFIYGPAQSSFDIISFVNTQPGPFKDYEIYAGGKQRKGGEIIQYIANNFSINPKLLLSIIEYQTGALSDPYSSGPEIDYPMGYVEKYHKGLYRQLVWAANILNNGFYGWRTGELKSFDLTNGEFVRLDPWQNAASVALQYYFGHTVPKDKYERSIHSLGILKTYTELFGDPWLEGKYHIPGSLEQPPMRLPFSPGSSWAFTGGPHTGWGEGEPFAALDFAPPNVVGGCSPTTEWATAIADGILVRKDTAIAVLDLDGDNNERTGWTIFYLHLKTDSIPPQGTLLKAGDPIGIPSCEGGTSTGTHVHIARKYNGEWINADCPLGFNLEGFIAKNGSEAYLGKLVRYEHVVEACVCSDYKSQLQASGNY